MGTRSQYAWLLAIWPALTPFDTAGTHFQVTASVAPRTRIASRAGPADAEVTTAGLERGYVDVAATCRVDSSDPAGSWRASIPGPTVHDSPNARPAPPCVLVAPVPSAEGSNAPKAMFVADTTQLPATLAVCQSATRFRFTTDVSPAQRRRSGFPS